MPPSSSTTFFRHAPAFAATARPAGVLPVRVTAATSGASMSPPPGASRRGRCGRRPRATRRRGGSARWPGRSRRRWRSASGGPALPAMRAGAAKRKTCHRGKFQGMTARTTPSGSKATKLRLASVATFSGARKRSAFPGVVVADPGALVGLGPALGQGLAHLQGHQAGQILAALSQEHPGLVEGGRAARKRGPSPALEGDSGRREERRDLLRRGLRVLANGLVRGGIDRDQGHGAPMIRPWWRPITFSP